MRCFASLYLIFVAVATAVPYKEQEASDVLGKEIVPSTLESESTNQQGATVLHVRPEIEGDENEMPSKREWVPASVPSPYPVWGNRKHGKKRATNIVLLNASPYIWKKGDVTEDRMKIWGKVFPDQIKPGKSHKITVERQKHDVKDAEVTYRLDGTSKPMSFRISYSHSDGQTTIWLRYQDELETMDNKKKSAHKMQWVEWPGGVAFILAGKEGEFISNDGPIAWQQAMLPTIGNLPLREIVMPRSHHAGLWTKASKAVISDQAFGKAANTVTQYMNLTHQLTHSGVRVLDVRPCRSRSRFKGVKGKPQTLFEGHGSIPPEWLSSGRWSGKFGATIEEMVDWINEFNEAHPGELIIFDIHSADAYQMYPDKRPAKLWDVPGAMKDLYETLLGLNHRFELDEDTDVSTMSLNDFVGNGKSAVLVRVHDHWLVNGFNGTAAQGFARASRFPINHRWTNRSDQESMIRDQEKSLIQGRPNRNAKLYNSDWLVTQDQGDTITAFLGNFGHRTYLVQAGLDIWISLFTSLWYTITDNTYPNWITVDSIHGTELKALVMTMNHCLVARRCGQLGGKVKGLPAPVEEKGAQDRSST